MTVGWTVPADLALVGLEHRVDYLDERRLAGAVLAEKRVDLAGDDLEADVVVGDNGREALRDPSEL